MRWPEIHVPTRTHLTNPRLIKIYLRYKTKNIKREFVREAMNNIFVFLTSPRRMRQNGLFSVGIRKGVKVWEKQNFGAMAITIGG